MPRQSHQVSSPATIASSSTAGSSPPAASMAASTPPPARGAGSSASAGSSAGSPEQVPPDRELQYLCPRTGCNTNLLLKGKYPRRQGLLPRLQELERRHLRVNRPVDQVPLKGLLALRLRVRGRRSGVGIHHPRRGTLGVLY
ncbi:unnamed protein product [Ectocarpus sp. 13 AM-2016]